MKITSFFPDWGQLNYRLGFWDCLPGCGNLDCQFSNWDILYFSYKIQKLAKGNTSFSPLAAMPPLREIQAIRRRGPLPLALSRRRRRSVSAAGGLWLDGRRYKKEVPGMGTS